MIRIENPHYSLDLDEGVDYCEEHKAVRLGSLVCDHRSFLRSLERARDKNAPDNTPDYKKYKAYYSLTISTFCNGKPLEIATGLKVNSFYCLLKSNYREIWFRKKK